MGHHEKEQGNEKNEMVLGLTLSCSAKLTCSLATHYTFKMYIYIYTVCVYIMPYKKNHRADIKAIHYM